MLEASQIAGTPICNAKLHQQRLKEAGFENIVEKKYFWPQNKWPRDRHYKLLGVQPHFPVLRLSICLQ